jgi:hypothetical protein
VGEDAALFSIIELEQQAVTKLVGDDREDE